MDFAGASWEIWDHADRYFSSRLHEGLREDLQELVESFDWEQIVTHGPEGEYGHRQHKGLWSMLREIIKGDFFVFNPFSKIMVSDKCRIQKDELLTHYQSQLSTFKHIGTFGPQNRSGIYYESFRKSP